MVVTSKALNVALEHAYLNFRKKSSSRYVPSQADLLIQHLSAPQRLRTDKAWHDKAVAEQTWLSSFRIEFEK